MMSNCRKVVHIAPDGTRTKYNSLAEANIATGFSYATISRLLARGEASRNGHRFEYLDEEAEETPVRLKEANSVNYFENYISDKMIEFRSKLKHNEFIINCFTLEQTEAFIKRVQKKYPDWEHVIEKADDRFLIKFKKSKSFLLTIKARRDEIKKQLDNEENKMKQIMDRIEEYKKLLLHYDSVIKDLEAR